MVTPSRSARYGRMQDRHGAGIQKDCAHVREQLRSKLTDDLLFSAAFDDVLHERQRLAHLVGGNTALDFADAAAGDQRIDIPVDGVCGYVELIGKLWQRSASPFENVLLHLA